MTGTSGPAVNLSSAGAAASLAQAKSRPYEAWKPEKQLAAEKAAFYARDYQLPEQQPIQTSPEGFQAALLAIRDQRATIAGPAEATVGKDDSLGVGDRDHVVSDRKPAQHGGAIQAASGALSTRRRRSESAPSGAAISPETPYALSAAEASHRALPELQDQLQNVESALEASRIHNIANANVQLYTSTPPVPTEVEEINRRNVRHAAAVSMARDMYVVAQRPREPSTGAAVHAAQREHRRAQSQRFVSRVDDSTIKRAITLQQTAQRLASEKLARMQDENEAYQNYYGTAPPPTRSRLSMRRKRTVSDTDASQVDLERSTEIRNQMSTLQSKLNEVDEQRLKDRDLLMQAARRNVNAAIHDMDVKMYAEKGKPSPAVQKEWEEKAQERARLESEAQTIGANRVSIGADRYMDRADVEAVARSRLQPTLNDINDRAEERRAKEIEQRLDAEQKRRQKTIERQREADWKAEEKRQKGLSYNGKIDNPSLSSD